MNDEQIQDLRARAEAKGDAKLVRICDLALGNAEGAFYHRCACAEAIKEGK